MNTSSSGGNNPLDGGVGMPGQVFTGADLPDLGALADLDSPSDSDFIARLFLNEDEFSTLMDTTPSPNQPGDTPLNFPPTPPTHSAPHLFPPNMLMPGYHHQQPAQPPPPLPSQSIEPPPISMQVPSQPHPSTNSNRITNTKQQQQQPQLPAPYQHPSAGFPFLATGQPKQVSLYHCPGHFWSS